MTWQDLLQSTHQEAVERGEPLPYEAVSEKVRTLGARLNLSEIVFPVHVLVPMLKRYAFEFQNGIGPSTWVVDVFIDINVPFETLFGVLESIFYANENPFVGQNRRHVADDLLYVVRLWVQQSTRDNDMILGSQENVAAVSQALQVLVQHGGLDRNKKEECQVLRTRIEYSMR